MRKLVIVLQYVSPCNYAYKRAKVVRNGHKVLVLRHNKQVLKRSVDVNGLVVALPQYILDAQPFLRMVIPCGFVRKLPQKVTLRNGASVMALPVQHGYCAVAIVAHLFKSLPKGVVVIDIGRAHLWP